MPDNSWGVELDVFVEAIFSNVNAGFGLEDALATHKIIAEIYKESKYDYQS